MRLIRRLAVLASSVAVVLATWAWSRGYVAREIKDRALQQPAAARATLRQLASLGQDAVPALLDAAVDPEAVIAESARRQVDLLMMRWAAQGDAVDSKYALIVSGLVDRGPQLTPSGRRWAQQVGSTALRLSETSRESVSTKLVNLSEQLFELAQEPSQVRDFPKPPPVTLREDRLVDFGPKFFERPPLEPQPLPTVDQVQQPEALVVASSPAAAPIEPAPRPQTPPGQAVTRSPILDDPVERPSVEASGPTALAWRRPQQASPPSKLADQRRSQATQEDQYVMPEAVRELLSGSQSDKLRLIDQLLTGRHEKATELLMQLAKDEEPRVRSSAISALGSSSNQRLTHAAWRLALTDEDPRVARLASELEKLLK